MTSKARFRNSVLLLSVAALVFATGCYRLTVRVAQAVPIEKPQQRVFVVVHEGSFEAAFARRLSRAISARLARHVTNRSTVVTGLEFDSGPLDREIAAFGPEGVLVVKPLSIRTGGQYGSVTYMSLSATLIDQSSKQTIWVAKAEADGFGESLEFAEGIVDTLAKSRMIPPAPAQPPSPPPRSCRPRPQCLREGRPPAAPSAGQDHRDG